MITQERLKEIITYDQYSGVFTYIARNGNRRNPGDIAGNRSSGKHLAVMIDKKSYLLHRLAFLYMNGVFPNSHVDHRNGDPTDNRFENLRPCTPKENNQNRGASPSNTGFLGVAWKKKAFKNKHFRASIMLNGNWKHIGYYETAKEAHRAYLIAKKHMHPFWDYENMQHDVPISDLELPGNLTKNFLRFLEDRNSLIEEIK